MTINATALVSVQLTGNGLGQGGNPFLSYQSSNNTSAPPPTTFTCAASSTTTFTVPSAAGYTVTGIAILPPPGSVNSKTLKGASGDTGFIGWTQGIVVLPVAVGQSIYITSVAAELLTVAYF